MRPYTQSIDFFSLLNSHIVQQRYIKIHDFFVPLHPFFQRYYNMHDLSIAKRYIIYVAGLFLLSLGVVLIVRSALGTTPISSINYVVSINTPLSLGTCTFAINMLLILGQFLILGHRCTRVDAVEILDRKSTRLNSSHS